MKQNRHANPWVITATVLLGLLATGINFTILAVSRPTIAADLDISVTTLVWLISGPILANALVTATAGKLGDLYGHRRVYLIGLVGSLLAAGASGVAWDGWSLIGFRVVGAVLGAALGPSSMAMISLIFPPAQRSTALGYFTLVGAGGPVLGLVIGGPLVESFGWRTIFWVQVPLLALAVVVAYLVLPTVASARNVSFDVKGNLVLAGSLVTLLLAVQQGPTWGWVGPKTLGLLALSIAGLWLFVSIERRVEHPLIPLSVVQTRSFLLPVSVLFFAQFGYMGGFILAPRLLREVGAVSDSRISLLLVPRPLTFAIAGVAAGYLVRHLGIRVIGVFGGSLVSISLVMMASTASHLSIPVVVGAIALSGLGMGAAQPSFTAALVNCVRDEDLGVAGAVLAMAIQVATSLGMNGLDSLQASLQRGVNLGASFGQTYLIGAAITGGAVVLSLFLPKRDTQRARSLETPPV
ncbi:MAG TPA: hypothetical protein DEG43_15320 [Acidimicrobiaceae bacterium]|nr:hypothetical protein [Acidimicrobiaceae bacterium]